MMIARTTQSVSFIIFSTYFCSAIFPSDYFKNGQREKYENAWFRPLSGRFGHTGGGPISGLSRRKIDNFYLYLSELVVLENLQAQC